MGDRLDEMKGNLKEGAGKVTGDEQTEAEGRGEATMAHGKREVKGAADKATGKVEEGIGRLTGDESERARGAGSDVKGDAERAG
jgi:uncharacterized protein YjbJ (UPF0337 family)